MSQILEKLGIYDLLAVLLSGISILTFTLLSLDLVYNIQIHSIEVNESIVFLVVSYFMGLIFQEVGSFIQNHALFKKNTLLDDALKAEDGSHIKLSCLERKRVDEYVKEKLPAGKTDYDNGEIYNYCKFYVFRNCNTVRLDRDQSIAAMSRSLSLYFCIMIFFSLIAIIFYPSRYAFILLGVSIFFTAVLYFRFLRFTKMRYINIYKLFYYNVVVKYNNENDQEITR